VGVGRAVMRRAHRCKQCMRSLLVKEVSSCAQILRQDRAGQDARLQVGVHQTMRNIREHAGRGWAAHGGGPCLQILHTPSLLSDT